MLHDVMICNVLTLIITERLAYSILLVAPNPSLTVVGEEGASFIVFICEQMTTTLMFSFGTSTFYLCLYSMINYNLSQCGFAICRKHMPC